jgi:hypothetical protein
MEFARSLMQLKNFVEMKPKISPFSSEEIAKASLNLKILL